MEEKLSIKLVIIGGAKSGKTTFIRHYLGQNININDYQPTLGANYCSKSINFHNRDIILDFWDTGGELRYDALTRIFLEDCKMIFIFYDSSDKASFERAKTFFNMAKDNTKDKKVVMVLVSNKYDLQVKSKENINKVSEEEALEYASKNNILFTHISIVEKYESGINELFDKALREYYKRNSNLFT